MDDPAIDALRRAVQLSPEDTALRVHLGTLLLAAGDADAAMDEAVAALRTAPADSAARALMAAVLRRPVRAEHGFDFDAAERELRVAAETPTAGERAPEAEAPSPRAPTLADIGGMAGVKERLEAAFLAPLRNPGLRALFGKSLRGGLLMYGPPGCGKTFIARALAGELGAAFVSVTIHDVLDPHLGESEQNLHAIFQTARRSAPCVLFIDELDTLGHRRGQLRGSALHGVVNQLLTELDGVDSDNEGVFTLAATNQPWDVDPALRRPGRFDRTVLVLPPDAEARLAIFAHHLEHRPVEQVDLRLLAARTSGFSGADIAGVCERAAEHALLDAVRSGIVRPIGPRDFDDALQRTRPSTVAWLDSVRNLVLYGEDDGTFDELRDHLKQQRRR